MPLLLDSSIDMDLNDVDDLFGDPVSLSLPNRSGNKQIQQRIEELRKRGCCQAIAWSKTGTIAYLTPDRQAIELRFLRSSHKDGSWDLSEPTPCNLVQGTASVPLVHLEWGTTNVPELAVVDAAGRVAIVGCSLALNNLYVTRKWDNDSIDDLSAVVGCHWLAAAPSNQHKPYNATYGPATKSGSTWQYDSSFIHAGGPSHPQTSKSAFFCISIGGMLRMFWSQAHGRQEETTIEIGDVFTSRDLITHASMAADKKHLSIALAKASGQLRYIRLELKWNITTAPGEKNPSAQNATMNPTLVDKHVASTYWNKSGTNDSNINAARANMSQLHLLPSLTDNTGASIAPPVIIVVRSCTPGLGSCETTQTVLDRWEVIEEQQNLHPALAELGKKNNKPTLEPPTAERLRGLEPIVLSKTVIGLQSIFIGKVLLLTFADGTVEYRDRFTLEELYTLEDTQKVMNLRQVGWTFTDNGPCTQVAFSPTYCSMIQMSNDGKVRWSKLHYAAGDFGDSMQKPQYSASIAGLTIALASCTWYQANYDDMLAIVRPYVRTKRFTQDWISELIRIQKVQVDYSEEMHHDSLMRNAPLQSCLSIMDSLGFYGELVPRSFCSKFALGELNVRNVVILITLASNTPVPVRDKMSPLDEHEVVEVLVGCVKWSLDLLAWLADSLFELTADEEFMDRLSQQRFSEFVPYLHEKNNVCLHMLLCSSSRSFLMALCRRVAHLDALSARTMDFYRKSSAGVTLTDTARASRLQLQQAYQKMQQVIASALLKAGQFEKLLSSLSADLSQSYHAFLPTLVKQQPNVLQGKQMDLAVKAMQNQLELGMLLGGSPPPAQLHVIKKFLNKDVAAFRQGTDPAALYFANFSLLEVNDDAQSATGQRAKGWHVDVFKRQLLRMSPDQQWRRCTRCAAVMEDVFASRPGFTFVVGTQRKCCCGGHWGLLPKGKLSL